MWDRCGTQQGSRPQENALHGCCALRFGAGASCRGSSWAGSQLFGQCIRLSPSGAAVQVPSMTSRDIAKTPCGIHIPACLCSRTRRVVPNEGGVAQLSTTPSSISNNQDVTVFWTGLIGTGPNVSTSPFPRSPAPLLMLRSRDLGCQDIVTVYCPFASSAPGDWLDQIPVANQSTGSGNLTFSGLLNMRCNYGLPCRSCSCDAERI